MRMTAGSVLGFLLLCVGGLALGEQSLGVRWKLSTTSVWPPAIVDGKVILKSGDVISAHAVDSGRLVWSQKLSNLRYGDGVLAAGAGRVYVLSDDGLLLLGATDGRELAKRTLDGPTSVVFSGRSLYVTAADGIHRYDAGGRLLQQARGFSGELRGAEGDYVAIYSQRASADPKTSPKRLAVVNLRSGKQSYEFKLLPLGEHRVMRMSGGRLVFIDFSRSAKGEGAGSNPRKLYYTEADYVQGNKLRDVSLSSKHGGGSAASDIFWIAGSSDGVAFLLNGGSVATLFAYDARQDKTLWSRSSKETVTGLLLHKGRLFTVATSTKGEASVVAYSADSGTPVSRNPIDAPGVGSPVAVDDHLLVRSRDTLYCFAPRGAAAAAPPAPAPATALVLMGSNARAGWRLFRDRVAGYLIQTPQSWTFDRSTMRSLGGVRFVIPFLRSSTVAGRVVPVGSLHLLTWEAAGRDASGLWQSVQAQRRQLNPDVRVVKLERVASVGGSGAEGILATYSFRGRQGNAIQLRSLCLVHHNVAFELRGWAGPQSPQEIWRDVQGIMDSFRPQTL